MCENGSSDLISPASYTVSPQAWLCSFLRSCAQKGKLLVSSLGSLSPSQSRDNQFPKAVCSQDPAVTSPAGFLHHSEVLMSILCLWYFEVVKWKKIIRLTHTVQIVHYPPDPHWVKEASANLIGKIGMKCSFGQLPRVFGFLGPWFCICLLKSSQ